MVQNFAYRLVDPNMPKSEKKKFFIYRLDTSKKYFVDDLPNLAVEQAAMQIFSHMHNSKADNPTYLGFIDQSA